MPRRGENIRKRKDGRWEARFPNGKNERGRTIYGAVYGSTYKEVKEKRHQILSRSQPRVKHETGKSFRDLLALWLADRSVRLKASTIYRYQYLIDTHIIPDLGSKPLDSISKQTIDLFLSNKLKCGRVNGSGGLSAAYVRSIALIVDSALEFGVEQGLCSFVNFKICKPSPLRQEIPILSKEQLDILEHNLLTGTDSTKLGVYISLYTGLRIGEICALTWNDVDLNNAVINVRNTVARVRSNKDESSKTQLIIDKPKTAASLRCIPICSCLLSLLITHSVKKGTQYVVSTNATFVSPRTFDYRFKKILDSCRLPHINYHALRHTFATRCVEAGVDVKSLSEILGHSNVSITLNTYVHSSMNLKRIQIEKIV